MSTKAEEGAPGAPAELAQRKSAAQAQGWVFAGGEVAGANGSYIATLGTGLPLAGNSLAEVLTNVELWEAEQGKRKPEARSSLTK